nr:reverse transcriptase domain-containing protein [Tanacetum cinerariifolium]
MRTRSSSNLPGESSPNPSSLNPKHRNRRRSKKPFILEESPIDTMADQRTMAKLLRAPTEGYAEAIVVPPILAEQFELKHSLINMITSDQFFGLEKDNPHDHIRWGSPSLARKRTLAFYNALNPADQDSLNSAAGGNLLERRTQDVLTIIENKSKELWDNIQRYVSAVAVNYNQGNFGYRPPGELKAITTRSGIVLYGPSVLMPPPFINPEEDECVEETLTDLKLSKFTIKVPPLLVQKPKPRSQRNYVVHQRDTLYPNIPYPSRMHKQKQQEKDEV